MGSKAFFAPLPMRAMAAELSGLQLRVLACVAAHDRMSLLTNKGQGCRASNERMREMVGCSYPKLCSALSDLALAGFLQREKLGRHTVYRVIYTDDDISLFGNVSTRRTGSRSGSDAAATCNRNGSSDAATCNRPFSESRRNQPKTAQQYIPLNGGIHSVETGKDNSLKVRVADAPRGLADEEDQAGVTEQGQLALFERAWKANPQSFSDEQISQWEFWLQDVFDHSPDDTARYRAQRLMESIDIWMWETGKRAEVEP